MLVAEKQQYTESYYPEVLTKEQSTPKSQPRVAPSPKPKRRNKVLPVIVVLIGFGLCANMVARYAIISQNQEEIASLEEALEAEKGVEEELKLDLRTKGDLKRIEEFAKTNLEMNYPAKEQVLFVELPEQKAKENTDLAIGTDEKQSLWSRIVGLLD